LDHARHLHGLITPFKDDDSIDYAALEKLVSDQVRQKVDGLVVCGTTAESATLTDAEKTELFVWMKKIAEPAGLKLIAGTGTNDTRETIRRTRACGELGYDQFLIVTPYYNKPQETGLKRHFTAVADAAPGEVILYNVPGRTGLSLSARLIAELAGHPKMRTIKEASGDLALASDIRCELATANHTMDLVSGDDPTFFPFLALGGVGTISVASHLLALPMRKILEAVQSGQITEARKLHDRYFSIFKKLFMETNPVPVKYAMAKKLNFSPRVRSPLGDLSEENRTEWDRLLAETLWP
ncbi:MAG: 4-hydroxy-tetrahydrodipicolinate synthase, partial [Proteobacteria bacterium]